MSEMHENLKRLRIECNMTLKDVAERLGTTEATAQRYETGVGIKSVPYERILKYAQMFGVAPSDIMGWSGDTHILSSESKDILTKWNRLSDKDKSYVMNTIDYLIDRGKK